MFPSNGLYMLFFTVILCLSFILLQTSRGNSCIYLNVNEHRYLRLLYIIFDSQERCLIAFLFIHLSRSRFRYKYAVLQSAPAVITNINNKALFQAHSPSKIHTIKLDKHSAVLRGLRSRQNNMQFGPPLFS